MIIESFDEQRMLHTVDVARQSRSPPLRSSPAPSPTPPSSCWWAVSARQCQSPHLPVAVTGCRQRRPLPAARASVRGLGVSPNRQPSSACRAWLDRSDCARFWMLLTWDAGVFGPSTVVVLSIGILRQVCVEFVERVRLKGRRCSPAAAHPVEAPPQRPPRPPAPRPRSATGRRRNGQGTSQSQRRTPQAETR